MINDQRITLFGIEEVAKESEEIGKALFFRVGGSARIGIKTPIEDTKLKTEMKKIPYFNPLDGRYDSQISDEGGREFLKEVNDYLVRQGYVLAHATFRRSRTILGGAWSLYEKLKGVLYRVDATIS